MENQAHLKERMVEQDLQAARAQAEELVETNFQPWYDAYDQQNIYSNHF